MTNLNEVLKNSSQNKRGREKDPIKSRLERHNCTILPKFEATGGKGRLVCAKRKALLWSSIPIILDVLFLIFFSPISLQDLHNLLINLIVIMVLKILDFIQPFTFIDCLCINVDSAIQSHLFVSLTHLQNVLEALKAYCHNPWVWTVEKITEWCNATLANEKSARKCSCK